MEDKIQNNLVYLTNNITNLSQVLDYLIQHDFISRNEKEIIEAETTTIEKNSKLLSVIEKKDWNRVENVFFDILLKTGNKHCADKIEGIPTSDEARNSLLHPKISKWWPDEKALIKSLHKRKFGSRLLIEELHERILADENRMVVLCESANAIKYSGMGGIGKTLTAKWYAHHFNDQYEHILWIDCGEGSLVDSFKKLAMELTIDNWDNYVKVEDYSRKSFQALSEFKCLWIYDNAENYKGIDGIINVLPKNQKNFSCLITSRSREWGIMNVGYGKISDLQLEIFSEEESLEFFEGNLEKEIKRNEQQLKELCRLMGNLPLALQLSVAALNAGEIDLQKYIEKTSAEDAGKIVEAQFDDYENTINKNIKISLDLILKDKKNGKLAYDILMVFGYIRPDNVQSKFFMRVFKSKVEIVKEAVDLLEKYSLVTRNGKKMEVFYDDGYLYRMFGGLNKVLKRDKRKVEMDLLNIHRLQQQVIRHTGKRKEAVILTKILSCEGYIDYKLIPYTLYADEKLQKQFPKVKTELLDQKHLQKLTRQKRFEECVQFAQFIHQELQSPVTKFNYAICLMNNGQLEECIKNFNELYEQEIVNEKAFISVGAEMAVLQLEDCVPSMNELYEPEIIIVKAFSDGVEMCLLQLDSEVSIDLVEGHLFLAYCKMNNQNAKEMLEKSKQVKMIYSQENLDILIQLVSTYFSHANYSITKGKYSSVISLTLDVDTKKINLVDCSLSLDSFDRLSPEDLKLENVSFFRDGQELEKVELNDFIDLSNIQRLTLSEMEKMILVGNVELSQLTHLTLENMNDVVCSSYFHSVLLTYLHLKWIKEVNVDLLPPTLTHLLITKSRDSYIRFVGGGVRKLKNLRLDYFTFEQVEECLSHLHTDNLLIRFDDEIGGKELGQLMNKEIKTMVVGRIKWQKDHFMNYSSQLDKEASCYLLEGGRGRAMQEKQFTLLSEIFGDEDTGGVGIRVLWDC